MVKRRDIRADSLDRLAFDVAITAAAARTPERYHAGWPSILLFRCVVSYVRPYFPVLPIGQKKRCCITAVMSGELKNVVERSVYRHGSSEHPFWMKLLSILFNAIPLNRPRPASGIIRQCA